MGILTSLKTCILGGRGVIQKTLCINFRKIDYNIMQRSTKEFFEVKDDFLDDNEQLIKCIRFMKRHGE